MPARCARKSTASRPVSNLPVFVVSNGSRPIRPPGLPNVSMVIVDATPDAADDWIAERITAADVCVTADIPLAARCLGRAARAVSPTGRHWTQDNIGNALAGREVSRHMREIGMNTGGPAALTRADRSQVPQCAGCCGSGCPTCRDADEDKRQAATNFASSFTSHSRMPPVMPASFDTIRTFSGRFTLHVPANCRRRCTACRSWSAWR